jgi:transcriptional regulator of acetoin/glycerol metabolism
MRAKVSLRALSPEERQAVEDLARSRTAPARTVERARIIAALAGGAKVAAVVRQVGVSRPTIYRWMADSTSRGPPG